ncbi:hypothetical protein Tco_1223484, partial [Tanacetum coccineum]
DVIMIIKLRVCLAKWAGAGVSAGAGAGAGVSAGAGARTYIISGN